MKILLLDLLLIFQKESPYLDDANEIIDHAIESGWFNAEFSKYLPNATKCLRHDDVQWSHFETDQRVVFKMENIYGMIILLAIGLGLATLTAIAEPIIFKAWHRERRAILGNCYIHISNVNEFCNNLQ